jgi:maltose/moltooligosaccharide transporter
LFTCKFKLSFGNRSNNSPQNTAMNTAVKAQKPRLKIDQIWNISFGFLGIQIGFALQNANMSRIFQTLGADIDKISFLWLAAPVTGLFVQPVIGYMSDRTWNRLGRRRPYFLTGAILASLALLIVPNSPSLWVAAGMLWILDASINVSMEPFRALVADMLPDEQRTAGFSTQTLFIGIGAVLASLMPYLFDKVLHLSNEAPAGQIPDTVKWSFYIGGIAYLGAVLWTVLTTQEYPPKEFSQYNELEVAPAPSSFFTDMVHDFAHIPRTMWQLGAVQFFSWFALFAMWIYTTPAVTRHIFGSTDTSSVAYNQGANWVGNLFAVYNGIAALVAFVLVYLARQSGRKVVHSGALVAGGLGLLSIFFIKDPQFLIVSMVGVGVAWASILAMPYAMLAGALPAQKMGVYMGIFNFFIVIPQIIAAGILGFFLNQFFGNDPLYALGMGGISMFIAATLTLFVKDSQEVTLPSPGKPVAAE